MIRRPQYTVAAAFASDRDASYAMRLFASASGADVRYTLRQVLGEDGGQQMVILEATCTDPAQVSRLETAMEGAHGMVVPAEAVQAAKAS